MDSSLKNPMTDVIRDLTDRALWETENLISAIPQELWNKEYDCVPMWKYVYHMLYSMDRWFINPMDKQYTPPVFHRPDSADLNAVSEISVTQSEINGYFLSVKSKISSYINTLTDDILCDCPVDCDMSRYKLILGQHRHWHRHMGIVYGFIINDTGRWPLVLNMLGEYPQDSMPVYY